MTTPQDLQPVSQDDYVDKCPPDHICTWCGRSSCGQCMTWRSLTAILREQREAS